MNYIIDSAVELAKQSAKIADALIKNKKNYMQSIVAWIDLLGFRKGMDQSTWDIESDIVKDGLKRIATFSNIAKILNHENIEIVQLNDAVVIGMKNQINNPENVTLYLEFVNYFFQCATIADYIIGGVGVRGVIAKGIQYNLQGNIGYRPTKVNGNELGFNLHPDSIYYYSPTSVLMNTAFARAYGVESSHQLKKTSSLYVDSAILNEYGTPRFFEKKENIIVENYGEFILVTDDLANSSEVLKALAEYKNSANKLEDTIS